MPVPSAITQRLFTSLSGGLIAACFSAQLCAAVVDSGTVAISIPANFDGVYLNLVTGATDTTGTIPGYDINLYSLDAANGMDFFFPNAANHGAVGTLTVAGAQALGTLVGPSSTFSNVQQVRGTNFGSAGTRFLGMRFINEAGAGQHYGYLEIESGAGAPPGFPAVIRRYVYESTANTPITIADAVVAGTWQALGPGPATNGQTEGISNNEVVGAIEALLPHPTNANILYVGAVNGGIWRTNNATAAAPSWTRLSDNLSSLSITSLEFDPTDATRSTLLAGSGRVSSLASLGGGRNGLFRSTDAGVNWTPITVAALNGLNMVSAHPRGATFVVATNSGLFRSTDTGASFTRISSGTGGTTGLPDGRFSDMASDPNDNDRYFAALTAATAGGAIGIYRSSGSGGASWIKVSDAAVDAAMVATSKVEIAVRVNTIALAIVTAGRLSAVFHSVDGGGTWANLGVPLTSEGTAGNVGIHAGGQGGLHLSITLDPGNSDIVYVGGDRQPLFNEGGAAPSFPNSIGAVNFSGRLFRGNASLPAATRWQPLTHSGTAGNSSPHADSRDMAFDAAGTLLESDDGGVYKRTVPTGNTGNWFSLNGDLQTTEIHSIAYDPVSGLVFSGTQDNGSNQQTSNANRTFLTFLSGDGGDNAVEVLSSTQSVRYSSAQNLGNFNRRSCAATGVCASIVPLALTPADGSLRVTGQFYSPIAANRFAPSRLIIGGSNGIYESLDRGDTTTQLNGNLRIQATAGTPIIYGVPGNANFLMVGANQVTPSVIGQIYRRTAAPPAALTLVNTLPQVNDLAIDPANLNRIFAVSNSNVWFSTDGGTNFNSVLGQLLSLTTGDIRAVAFIPNTDPALVVGTVNGVFIARGSSNFSLWVPVSTGLPKVPVFELDYDASSSTLIAGTLGRGAWRLRPFLQEASPIIFRNGFE